VKTKILISLQIRCFKDLAKYGAEQVLQREYGQYVAPVEPGYDFSVLVDLENLPESKGRPMSLPAAVSLNQKAHFGI
jgi:actin related protein 2/3 complex subunit 2